jgi:hypothetical protein
MCDDVGILKLTMKPWDVVPILRVEGLRAGESHHRMVGFE